MTTGLRHFRTTSGVNWDVWDVLPTDLERRFERPATPPAGVERRMREAFRVNLGPEMAKGWLIFASGSERRRLAPIPAGWNQLPDGELERLCDSAAPVSDREHQ